MAVKKTGLPGELRIDGPGRWNAIEESITLVEQRGKLYARYSSRDRHEPRLVMDFYELAESPKELRDNGAELHEDLNAPLTWNADTRNWQGNRYYYHVKTTGTYCPVSTAYAEIKAPTRLAFKPVWYQGRWCERMGGGTYRPLERYV